MKVVKLDNRHNLKRKGYAWAFKFDDWETDSNNVEKAVRKLEGWSWDNTFWGKANKDRYGNSTRRPYYVGVKNESTLTLVMLTL